MLAIAPITGLGVYLLTHSTVFAAGAVGISCLPLILRAGAQASLAAFVLLMPLQYLLIALLQFNGVAQYEKISAIKELVLVGAICWRARSVAWRFTFADGLLCVALISVCFEQLFHTDVAGLRVDWEWSLVYLLGRLSPVTRSTEEVLAKAAVWICAALALLGIWEVEVLGPLPRTLLLQTTTGESKLPTSFVATGYAGFRAASTMVSPLAFSGLCMVALVLWWTYMKNPVPAIIIGTGLVLTVTRSAVIGVIVGIGIIALRRFELKRAALWGVTALVSLSLLVPAFDLSSFVRASITSGADTSVVGHQESVIKGIDIMLTRPLGTGAGTVGPRSYAKNASSIHVESSFLTIAIEYGMAAGALYAAFFAACLSAIFKLKTPLGYAAFSILVSYGVLLAVGPLHLDIPLAFWVWVPVGMCVTRSAAMNKDKQWQPSVVRASASLSQHVRG